MKQFIFIICISISLISCATTENISRTESRSEKYMDYDNKGRVIRGTSYDEYKSYNEEDLTDKKLGHKKGMQHFANYLFNIPTDDYVPSDKAYEHYDEKRTSRITDIEHLENNTVKVTDVTTSSHKTGSKKIKSKEQKSYEKGRKDAEKTAKGIGIFLAILSYIM